MASMNRVILAGNITRDPEIRFTGAGVPVCSFGLAVNRVRSRDKEAVDFFDVSAWRELGENVANHKRKGDPILIEGRLQYRTWEAKDGSKRSKVDVVADNVQFLGKGNGSGREKQPGWRNLCRPPRQARTRPGSGRRSRVRRRHPVRPPAAQAARLVGGGASDGPEGGWIKWGGRFGVAPFDYPR